jgi:hypothetical protein
VRFYVAAMSTVQEIEAAVRQLSGQELAAFRDWFSEFDNAGQRADWSGHAARVREIFGEDAPPRENVVLALREEERF